MAKKCAVQPTRHAKQRALERNLSQERIEEVLYRGRKTLIGGRKARHVLGIAGVVAVTYPCHHLVVTAYRRD